MDQSEGPLKRAGVKFSDKNRDFGQKIERLINNPNFGKTSNFRAKSSIKNLNFNQKSKIW